MPSKTAASRRDERVDTRQGRPLSKRARALMAVLGPVPVSLVAASTFGIVGFKWLTVAAIPPALAGLAVVAGRNREARNLVTDAVTAGLVSTLLYDLFRWTFVLTGLMERDPIPHLGVALGLEPGWVFGYAWRFVGNGCGLAITFYALTDGRAALIDGRVARGPALGTGYGLLVCSGLLAVLAFTPHGQTTLFPLQPGTVAIAVGGHVIYGATLGFIARRRHHV